MKRNGFKMPRPRDLVLRLVEKAEVGIGTFTSKVASFGRPTMERKRNIDQTHCEDVYATDPIVGAIIDWKAIRVLGKGFRVKCFDINGNEIVEHELHQITRNSKPYNILDEAIRAKYWSGTGFLEINDKHDGFRAVSPKKMRITVDDEGTITEYTQEIGGNNPPKWSGDDVKRIVRIPNRPLSDKMAGISDIESIDEVASILRNMQIDLSNFIESKAYAPIIFILGTKERPWNKTDIDNWLNAVDNLNPGDVMAVGGDVDFKIPDVSSLDISNYLEFFASLVVSGLKAPGNLTSMIKGLDAYAHEAQENNFKYYIESERKRIAEILEIDLYGQIILARGYSDVVRVEIEWIKHTGEEERMAVNSVVQLLQNMQISHETADAMLALPANPRNGTMLETANSVDNPEGSNPSISPEAGNNTMEETGDDDGRATQSRKNVSQTV